MNLDQEGLKTLACEWEKRPKEAPSFFDLLGSRRGVRREGPALVVEYDSAAADAVEALMEAERLCCPHIGWELERGPALRLRVSASEAQLEVMEQCLSARECHSAAEAGS